MNSTILTRFMRVALLVCLSFGVRAATVDLVSGPYSGCPGSACAKGNKRSGTDATVSSASYTLNAPSGSFTSPADVGKRGVVIDWNAANTTGGTCWAGYACYSGKSCQFTVSAVNSTTSITVTPVAGCGGSGIGFAASGNAFWAIGSDDSTPLHNAVTAAAGGTLTVPSNYQGFIYTGTAVPANTAIRCAATSATFFDPKLNSSQTAIFTPSSGFSITGCHILGTEPPTAYYDVLREYNVAIRLFKGVDNVLIQNNVLESIWGTYMIGTSGASNVHITGNTLKNCGLYGVQLNQTGGTSPGTVVDHNTFENCQIGSEDSSGVSGTPNKNQTVSNNYLYVTANRGTGYFNSQTSRGLGNTGASAMNAGVAASGSTPNSTEYSGVSYTNNTVCGAHTYLQPCSSTSQCNYTRFYGSVVSNNTCSNGCNKTAVTSSCPLGTGGGTGGGTSLPVISAFTASPAASSSGDAVTLSLSATNATTLSINQGVGTVTGTSVVVHPTATTTYILTATNASGSVTASATVTVSASGGTSAPTISAFSCAPGSITAGSATTCSWTTTNATTLSINQGIGVVTGASKALTPPASATYTLTATNSAGSTTASATVNVSIGPSLGTASSGSWPTVPTVQNLFQAADHSQTTLASAITSTALSVPLAAAGTFVQYEVITVDSEQMEICSISGSTATICTGTRGLAGTTAMAHNAGAQVKGRMVAIYHNRKRNEIKAVETDFHANHTGYGHFGDPAINGSCWPNKVADDGCLFVATDNAIAKLTGSVTSTATSFAVDSSTWFLANEIALVDNELVKIGSVSTGTLGSLTRGFDGTVALAHSTNAQATSVLAFLDFYALANEWVALETDTFGNTGSTVSCPCAGSAGVSWPNHAVTLAELGLDTNPGTVSAAMENRLTAEIIAYLADVHAHP